MFENRSLLRITAVALWTLSVGAAAGSAAVQKAAQPIDGQYIVVLRGNAVRPANAGLADSRKTLAQLAHELADSHRGNVGRQYGHALQGFTFAADFAAAEAMSADPRVAYVAEDGWVEASGKPAPATDPAPTGTTPVAGQQVAPPSWGLDRVDQHPAALDALYNYVADGTGIDIYMVDTGIRSTHTDFGGRVDTVNAFTAISDGYGTEDCNGHGTHTAGIAAGTTYGVAKNAKLHPVRVLDCYGRGAVSGIVAGIDWITARYPDPTNTKTTKPATKAVANLSFATTWTQALDDAVTNSIAGGVSYVVAAGNGGSDSCFVSPARVPTAITVGASTSTDAKASYSNVGSCLDLFAPGDSIVSSYDLNDTDAVAMSGTSMSAPHVTGTVAMLLSVNPNLSPADVATLVKAAATTGAMSGLDSLSPNRLLFAPFSGAGVDMAPVAAFTVYCAAGSCTFDATPAADDRGISAFAWTYGNGKTGSGEKVSVRYTASIKSVTVTLKVTDTIGQTSTIQQLVQTGN
jgi:serine protease